MPMYVAREWLDGYFVNADRIDLVRVFQHFTARALAVLGRIEESEHLLEAFWISGAVSAARSTSLGPAYCSHRFAGHAGGGKRSTFLPMRSRYSAVRVLRIVADEGHRSSRCSE